MTLHRHPRHILTTLIFLVLFIGVVACDLDQQSQDISDSEAIAMFQQHHAVFSEIIDLLDADHNSCTEMNADDKSEDCLIRIIAQRSSRDASEYKVDDRTGPGAIITTERLKQYAALTERIGLHETFVRRLNSGEVKIIYFRAGIVAAGSSRAFIYRPENPSPLYASLDNPLTEPIPSENWREGYRHLEGDWYLYTSRN